MNKIRIVSFTILIFIVLQVFAGLMFYGVWITAPTENIADLKNLAGGVFVPLIIGVFSLGSTIVNSKNSWMLANKIEEGYYE